MDAQPPHDPFAVGFDRAHADAEAHGDFLVALAFSDQHEHFTFADGELRKGFLLSAAIDELLQGGARDILAEERFARIDRFNSPQHLLRRGLFGNIPVRAGLDDAEDIVPVVVDGQVLVEAKCWGVEDLSLEQRVEKAIAAGVDQFGGEACPEVIVQLVQSGRIPEERIDESIRRLLRDKFRLGLFDNPYLDSDSAEKIVGSPDFKKAGELAQRKAIVLLKNAERGGGAVLPLRNNLKIFVENIKPETAAEYGQVVDRLGDAELAILRLKAPYEPREGFLDSRFHAGDLDFKGEEKRRLLDILERIPSIVVIHLDRPAVIPEIAEKSVGLLGEFGAADSAVLDVIFGRFQPTGKLPFELPSSMEAVRNQKEDLPYDSVDPLFHFGHGLTY